jgi:selenocysteine lyase/cysteine desulfurase
VDPAGLAERLDRDWDVAVRAGLHCAPRAHALLGTTGTGAVRFSLGWASTDVDVDRALAAVAAVLGARSPLSVRP